jgi:Flp pilus assembly protein TadG
MLRRLLRDTQASLIVEFAICLPVLCIMFLGSYIVVDLIACNRKVAVATRTLTDLAARSLSPSSITSSPSGTDATSVMTAAALTLIPYSNVNATENLALLRVCDATHAYVIWSQAVAYTAAGASTPATPVLTAGSLSSNSVVTVPANMITSPIVPTSPDGSNVCSNFSTGTSTKTQVGTAGGYLFVAEVDYPYQPLVGLGWTTTVPLGTILYMSPRLF